MKVEVRTGQPDMMFCENGLRLTIKTVITTDKTEPVTHQKVMELIGKIYKLVESEAGEWVKSCKVSNVITDPYDPEVTEWARSKNV